MVTAASPLLASRVLRLHLRRSSKTSCSSVNALRKTIGRCCSRYLAGGHDDCGSSSNMHRNDDSQTYVYMYLDRDQVYTHTHLHTHTYICMAISHDGFSWRMNNYQTQCRVTPTPTMWVTQSSNKSKRGVTLEAHMHTNFTRARAHGRTDDARTEIARSTSGARRPPRLDWSHFGVAAS